jgi:hypothetical protein
MFTTLKKVKRTQYGNTIIKPLVSANHISGASTINKDLIATKATPSLYSTIIEPLVGTGSATLIPGSMSSTSVHTSGGITIIPLETAISKQGGMTHKSSPVSSTTATPSTSSIAIIPYLFPNMTYSTTTLSLNSTTATSLLNSTSTAYLPSSSTAIIPAASNPIAVPTSQVQQPAVSAAPIVPVTSCDNPCSVDGALICIGTSSFGLCNFGCAVSQPLEAGVICANGEITKRSWTESRIGRFRLLV